MRRHGLSSLLLSPIAQSGIGFIIPTIILLGFSGSTQLGPIGAMMLALAFPVALELYSLRVRRKPSLMSLFAIIGILIVGAISLLGLNEAWLAVRRAIVYDLVAIGLIIALHFKRDAVDKALSRVIDMDKVHAAARDKGTDRRLLRHINRVAYIFAALLIGISVVSYVTTLAFITAPAGTSEFNAEYAKLRIASLLFITGPLFIGMSALLIYLMVGFERLTGVDIGTVLKKKR